MQSEEKGRPYGGSLCFLDKGKPYGKSFIVFDNREGLEAFHSICLRF